jgi:hypothetical protein
VNRRKILLARKTRANNRMEPPRRERVKQVDSKAYKINN